ncbi:efflux RND transporter periplasmic adaptor subunit [Desulfobulbus rhabdoformis]|uniref:efflux RND transporter periplasmic adaptor subunit n=1 Tax=Desulfobulbus rhabdoformis TaxID=34032 RepID=UPI0019643802|nr:efflux RND transporter periplasmic adaptor subunit [Desulfobulbus rhabdoformis]MBM9614703.1 efflux RND transporter periplasmic adaptor subunit [Desulfobulbus rhabdoformis]
MPFSDKHFNSTHQGQMTMPKAQLWIILGCLFLIQTTAWGSEPLTLEGMLEPSEIVDYSCQSPGILSKIYVERGDTVKEGQLLAELQSGVDQAIVQLARAKVEFGLRKAKRNEDLFKQKLLSAHQKDELETEIRLARMQLKEAQERLKLRKIRSTINGVIVKRTGAPGEYVNELPFLTAARIDPLNVEVIVPAALYGKIQENQSAVIEPDEPIGGRYTAKVVIIDQVIDAASGTFGVRLLLPNNQGKVPAGLKCRVYFSDTVAQQATKS